VPENDINADSKLQLEYADYLKDTDVELSMLHRYPHVKPELDMGPFLLTQSNPIHQLMDPIQSNP